jgi:hypothetical protein
MADLEAVGDETVSRSESALTFRNFFSNFGNHPQFR